MASKIDSSMKKRTIYIVIIAIVVVLIILFVYSNMHSNGNVQTNSNNINNPNNTLADATGATLYQNIYKLPGCVETDSLLDPSVIGTTTDNTGSYTDRCDDNGNLIEYYCAVYSDTGNSRSGISSFAANKTIDCGGKCSYGKCDNQCPGAGNFLTYSKIDSNTGEATFSDNFGNFYSCELQTHADQTYNCKTDPSIGKKVKIIQNDGADGYCFGNSFTMSVFDTSLPQSTSTCYYSCTVA